MKGRREPALRATGSLEVNRAFNVSANS